MGNEEPDGFCQAVFAAAVMRQLEGAVIRNFDLHDVELTLGDGSGVTVSEVALSEVTEEVITQAVDRCMDALPIAPKGVLILLEVVPQLFRLRFLLSMARTAKCRCPADADFLPVGLSNLQGPPLARLTIWCRTS